jgi:protein-S-isoprenylcysteine O-methyltransferase Ste14
MDHSTGSRRALWQVIFSVVYLSFFPPILFWLAGDWRWIEGWIFSALLCLLSLATVFYLYLKDPALLNERFGSPVQKNQKPWDKVLVVLFIFAFLTWYAIMPLDARQFEWSPHFPIWVKVIGALLFSLGFYLLYRAMKENTYAAPVIKMQKERGQTVIATGPYSIVRHPMYTGGTLVFLGGPLLLGSLYGLFAGFILSLMLALRTFGEEAMLRSELPGYADYRTRVRWRLIPYLF